MTMPDNTARDHDDNSTHSHWQTTVTSSTVLLPSSGSTVVRAAILGSLSTVYGAGVVH